MKNGTFVATAVVTSVVLLAMHEGTPSGTHSTTQPKETTGNTTLHGSDGHLAVQLQRKCAGGITTLTLSRTNTTKSTRTTYVIINGKRGPTKRIGGGNTFPSSVTPGKSATSVVVVDEGNRAFSKTIKNC
jgi:hypothetical protein